MKNLFLVWFFVCCHGLLLQGQPGTSITFNLNCLGSQTFLYDDDKSPDGSGRYVYSWSSYEIAYNSGDGQWEMRADGGDFDVYAINTFDSSPNPPDLNTGTWSGTGIFGCTLVSNVSGSGTQSGLGGDSCADLGGDTDNDGTCGDSDLCPGFDDNIDQDNDGIPDGCDDNPTIPDGVLITASCLNQNNSILFTYSSTDGTGRNVYRTTFANGLEVRYNLSQGRWEIRASSGTMTVYLFNNFNSWPDPPGSAGAWEGTSVLNCNSSPTPTINGSGTQNNLGCTISIGTPSVTQPACGGDGEISVSASGARGSINYTLKKGGVVASNNGTGTFKNLDVGTYTIVASDGSFPAGVCEASTSSIVLVLQDNIAPSIVCPSNIVAANDAGLCSAVVTYATPTGSDNCGISSITRTGGPASGSTFSVGITTVTYEATDAVGNSKTCSFTVTVEDDEDPFAVCQDITVNLGTLGVYSLDPTELNGGSVDNCNITGFGITTTVFDCDDVGRTFPIQLYVTDIAGNFDVCTANVTVGDAASNCNQPPSAVCQSIVVNADASCQATITPAQINNGSSDPDGDPLTLSLNNEGPFSPGTYSVELTASDGQSEDKCTATVVVIDNTLPIVICPADITVQCAGDVPAPNTDLLSFSDNCGLPIIPEHLNDVTDGEFNPEVQERIYQVTDRYGNMSQCTQKITIEDTTDPLLLCPQQFTVNVNENCEQTLVDVTAAVYVEDNCGTDQFLTVTQSPVPGTVVTANFNFVFTARDRSGNTSTCTVPAVVVDPISPSITCPGNITVSNDAGACGAVVDYVTPVGTDNCPGAITEKIIGLGSGAFFPLGSTVVKYEVSDVFGNKNTCDFTVTVNDTETPSITCPGNITVSNDAGACGAVVDYVPPVGTDNCPGAITKQLLGLGSGAFFPLGSTIQKYEVSDAIGNKNTCEFAIIVNDDEAAVARCKSTTITLNNGGIATLAPSDINNGSSDNCDVPLLSIDLDVFDCYELGDHIVTLTAGDSKGQSSTCTAVVTVEGDDADCDNVADLCDLCPGGDDLVDNNNDGSPDCIDFPGVNKLIDEWRCGNKGRKVTICHIPNGDYSKRNTLCVSTKELAEHLAHGDYIGPCDNASCGGGRQLAIQPLGDQPPVEQLRLYPNPASGKLRVEFGLDPEAGTDQVLVIFNTVGQQVFTERVDGDLTGGHQIDISTLRSGIYYVQVRIDGNVLDTRKLVVSR